MIRRIGLLVLILVLLTSVFSFAASIRSPYRSSATRSRHHRARKAKHRRIIVWNPVLRGSRESMLRQNEEIDRLQLPRIANDLELQELELREELVPLHESSALSIASNLEPIRRYCRPWTRDFVEDLSQAFYEKFHKPIYLTSAVRTVEQQAKLRRSNGNAAPIEGDTASSHLAGLTVDIGKAGMSRRERAFVDQYVLQLQDAGLVEAAEERRQACYHIMVSDRYTGWREEQRLASGTTSEAKPSAP